MPLLIMLTLKGCPPIIINSSENLISSKNKTKSLLKDSVDI